MIKFVISNLTSLFAFLLLAAWPVTGFNNIGLIDITNKKADELAFNLAGLNPIATFANQIDFPEDDSSKREEISEAFSGSEPSKDGQSKNGESKKVNKTATGPTALIHMTFDDMCKQAAEKNVKVLPVYVVAWELKECSNVNEIPLKRFQMEKYRNKKPKFDIPGLRIPMKGKEMALLMVDPDAPSKKNHRCRSWLHWLVINIRKGNVTDGNHIVEYSPPSPHHRSGPHRYHFLLYEQSHHISRVDDSENNFSVRCGFSVRRFAEDNDLIGPVAINMFLTQNGAAP